LAVDDDPAVLAGVARDERSFIHAGPDVRARRRRGAGAPSAWPPVRAALETSGAAPPSGPRSSSAALAAEANRETRNAIAAAIQTPPDSAASAAAPLLPDYGERRAGPASFWRRAGMNPPSS